MTTKAQEIIQSAIEELEEFRFTGDGEYLDEDIKAFLLVMKERIAQEEKWGEQNHPLHDPEIKPKGTSLASHKVALTRRYFLPSADLARGHCNIAAKMKKLTWLDILTEEHCELAEAGAEGPEAVMEELVQTAAVALAAIASELRRRRREEAARDQS